MDLQTLSETWGKLWVLTIPRAKDKHYPWMQLNGRMECFTSQELAMQAQAAVREQQKSLIQAQVRLYDGPDAIMGFFNDCLHHGIEVFYLNHGGQEWKELWFRELAPDWHEATVLEEASRSLRYLMLRSREYEFRRAAMTPEEQQSSAGLGLTEMMLTVRYNAYRELYRGLLYVLIDQKADGVDYFTLPALQKAKTWLAAEHALKCGFGPAELIHAGNRGGEITDGTEGLYTANDPEDGEDLSKGLITAFTDYQEAVKGRDLFRQYQKPCSIVAMTMPEILAKSAECAGLLIDMNTLDFVIQKSAFGEFVTYGEMNGGILVHLKQPEEKDAESEADK